LPNGFPAAVERAASVLEVRRFLRQHLVNVQRGA
jgi:hypothetical protein